MEVEVIGAASQGERVVSTEARTTACQGQPCERCGRPLKGRQERFCSDRCRMRAKLQHIKPQLRARMHDPVAHTGKWLTSVVQGYFNYHAVPGNLDSLGVFRERVTRLWRRTLLSRSQTHRLPWTRMHRLAVRWIPAPRVLHPYPEYRFAARYLR